MRTQVNFMFIYSYLCLAFLTIVGIFLYFFDIRRSYNKPVDQTCNTNSIRYLRVKHLKMYLLGLLIEWIQGPYLFRLYADYCEFKEFQIAMLYLIGIVLTPIVLPFMTLLRDKLGTVKSLYILIIIYAISLILKISKIFSLQFFSRILGVIGASNLLIFIDEWLALELSKLRFADTKMQSIGTSSTIINENVINYITQISYSLVAIVSGILADCITEWMGFGPVSSYCFALIPLLFLCKIFVYNTGQSSATVNTCIDDFNIDEILQEDCICGNNLCRAQSYKCYAIFVKETVISLYSFQNIRMFFPVFLQALIECTLYVFMFSWTPMLELSVKFTSRNSLIYLPLGVIFSCFMASLMIGGLLFQLFSSWGILPTKMLICTTILLAILNFLLSRFSPIQQTLHPRLCLAILILMKIGYGMYFPAVQWLKSHTSPIIPQHNLFSYVADCAIRIPVNILVICLLIIPFMPAEFIEFDVNTKKNLQKNYLFHYMQPSNLFLVAFFISLVACFISILLHAHIAPEVRHYGTVKGSERQIKRINTIDFRLV